MVGARPRALRSRKPLPLWLGDGAVAFADRAAAQLRRARRLLRQRVEDARQDTRLAFDAIFRHAARVGRDVDLHIDETNEPKCRAPPVCDSLRDARSLNTVTSSSATRRLSRCSRRRCAHRERARRRSGGVTVVRNLFTNMCLQDRRGTNAMAGAPIAADVARRRTGAGSPCRAASCGRRRRRRLRQCARPRVRVRPTTTFASSEMQWRSDSDTAPTAGAWAGRPPAPARARLRRRRHRARQPADVISPSARRTNELLSRPQSAASCSGWPAADGAAKVRRTDDLVAKEVQRSGAGEVQRGATKVDGRRPVASRKVAGDCVETLGQVYTVAAPRAAEVEGSERRQLFGRLGHEGAARGGADGRADGRLGQRRHRDGGGARRGRRRRRRAAASRAGLARPARALDDRHRRRVGGGRCGGTLLDMGARPPPNLVMPYLWARRRRSAGRASRTGRPRARAAGVERLERGEDPHEATSSCPTRRVVGGDTRGAARTLGELPLEELGGESRSILAAAPEAEAGHLVVTFQ